MKERLLALTIATALAPLALLADAPETEDSQKTQASPLTPQPKSEPCPTVTKVLPCVWIEPVTGNERTALRLYCPGRDNLDEESLPGPGLPDDRISAAVRSSG